MKSLWKKILIIPVDPLGAKKDKLIEDFIQKNPKSTFIFAGVSKETANFLQKKFKFACNEIGVNNNLHFDSFHTNGKKYKYLRRVANYYKKNIKVIEDNNLSDRWKEALALSNNWKKNKSVKKKEVRLFTRPLLKDFTWGVRHFYCYKNNELLAYIFFDPIYKNQKINGYLSSILRSKPHVKPQGVLDFIILEALKKFKKEIPNGYLSLGFSPLYNIHATEKEKTSLRLLLKALFQYGNRLYNFKGLAHHKNLYAPKYEKLYLCTKRSTPTLSTLSAILRARSIEVSHDIH